MNNTDNYKLSTKYSMTSLSEYLCFIVNIELSLIYLSFAPSSACYPFKIIYGSVKTQPASETQRYNYTLMTSC